MPIHYDPPPEPSWFLAGTGVILLLEWGLIGWLLRALFQALPR